MANPRDARVWWDGAKWDAKMRGALAGPLTQAATEIDTVVRRRVQQAEVQPVYPGKAGMGTRAMKAAQIISAMAAEDDASDQRFFDLAAQFAAIAQAIANRPEPAAPVVTVNVPPQAAPTVTVSVPATPAPVVNVTMPEPRSRTISKNADGGFTIADA
jgi:hypothetical protein